MNNVVDIWISIIEKYSQADGDALKQEELIVFRVFSFVTRIEMSSVSGMLYNMSPKLGLDQHKWAELRITAEALNTIGDNETAKLLFEAVDVFENLPEPIPKGWEELMGVATSQLPDGFWEAIESRIPGIYDSLETYTLAYL